MPTKATAKLIINYRIQNLFLVKKTKLLKRDLFSSMGII